jgi:hypothetical protein
VQLIAILWVTQVSFAAVTLCVASQRVFVVVVVVVYFVIDSARKLLDTTLVCVCVCVCVHSRTHAWSCSFSSTLDPKRASSVLNCITAFANYHCTFYGLRPPPPACSGLESTSETVNPIRHFDRIPCTGDRPIARPLPKQDSTAQENEDTHPCLERDSNPRYHCSSCRRQYVPYRSVYPKVPGLSR